MSVHTSRWCWDASCIDFSLFFYLWGVTPSPFQLNLLPAFSLLVPFLSLFDSKYLWGGEWPHDGFHGGIFRFFKEFSYSSSSFFSACRLLQLTLWPPRARLLTTCACWPPFWLVTTCVRPNERSLSWRKSFVRRPSRRSSMNLSARRCRREGGHGGAETGIGAAGHVTGEASLSRSRLQPVHVMAPLQLHRSFLFFSFSFSLFWPSLT